MRYYTQMVLTQIDTVPDSTDNCDTVVIQTRRIQIPMEKEMLVIQMDHLIPILMLTVERFH